MRGSPSVLQSSLSFLSFLSDYVIIASRKDRRKKILLNRTFTFLSCLFFPVFSVVFSIL